MLRVTYKKIRNVKDPVKAHLPDAGWDFFIPKTFDREELFPQHSIVIPSGIIMYIPFGWALLLVDKSGISTKHGLIIGAKLIDCEYTDEIHYHLINTGTEPVILLPEQKIVQGIFLQVPYVELFDLDKNLPKSKTRQGGFGSTGSF